jgi:FeS assembly protein IscX
MRWTDVEEIAEILEETYPEEDVENIRFTKLHKYVVNLLDFDDDPGRSNERVLEAIQGKWIELRQEND